LLNLFRIPLGFRIVCDTDDEDVTQFVLAGDDYEATKNKEQIAKMVLK
jgi:hypothetical protein